jgi:hypothetical protein
MVDVDEAMRGLNGVAEPLSIAGTQNGRKVSIGDLRCRSREMLTDENLF